MSTSLVLVLNCGSSSIKFALLNPQNGEAQLTGLAECLGLQDARIKYQFEQQKQALALPEYAAHNEAMQAIVALLSQLPINLDQLVAVGHRVVHGGEQFTSSVVIDEATLAGIGEVSPLAPLHNPANLSGIEAATQAFPALPQVAVFDTAFHQSMPKESYLYALPYQLYQDHGVRRYGFHGTSHRFVSAQAAEMLNKPLAQTRLISAHLGNGCSITAISGGKSLDTSMGLTPLEGLVMGTRSGDIDPGLPPYLAQVMEKPVEDIYDLLNKQSGLAGLSELSSDCRALEEAAQQGHEGAQLALNIFCYRLSKYIAAYMVPLGGLDALIFTGGIGENSSFIREQVLNKLAFLGLKADETANLACRFGHSGNISSGDTPALVIPTNEELVIAQDAFALITAE